MISIDNQPLHRQASDRDFTTEAYRQLIGLARASYQPADYRSIPWGQRFVLWRHDCDFSLNRSLALARIEAELGLRSTFFLNPHCEYYNLLQRDQLALVKELIRLGHDIGLHFDSAIYANLTGASLQDQVAREADLLEHFVGVRPAAFSFHNPTAFHLSCEEDSYAGLVNCYSRRFKSQVPYCSDSNGYWRFRRLHDVLSAALDPCLQVLTHPGWWQDKPMPPRQRIFRSVYGRAKSTMMLYDQGLENHGRENLAGAAQAIGFLRPIDPGLFELCDYLWNTGQPATLFVELWRVHELQLCRLCKALLRKEWQVPAVEVNEFFDQEHMLVDGWRLFCDLFEDNWQMASGQDEANRRHWVDVRKQLTHGHGHADAQQLVEGNQYVCGLIQAFAIWGKSGALAYDGLADLASIGLATRQSAAGDWGEQLLETEHESPGFSREKWMNVKTKLFSDLEHPDWRLRGQS